MNCLALRVCLRGHSYSPSLTFSPSFTELPRPEMDAINIIPLPGCREPFSSISHLLGAAVFAGLAFSLVRRGSGNRWRTTSLSLMSVSSVQLLLLSGTYHLFWPGPTREFMLRADVAAVFLLIAGSMTPVHAILFTGWSRSLPLGLVWTVAIIGIFWRMFFCDNNPGPAGIAFFLCFGWGSAITAIVLWRRYGWTFVQPAVMAGLAYTVGAIGLVFHRPILVPGIIGPHESWHIAVLIGLGFQWRFVFQFASGMPTAGCGHD